MRNSAPHGFMHAAILLVLGVVACAAITPESAVARTRQGDRFGIRGGIWPQSAVVGVLGPTIRWLEAEADTNVYAPRVNEPSAIVPYIELFGMFHIEGAWWAEGSIGWSSRRDVEVQGFGRADVKLLGRGRIDFFPLFAGIRRIQPLSEGAAPHNIYGRAGLSVVFANESPSDVRPSLTGSEAYSPGTEGAFGFLAGAGAEYYVDPAVAFVADISYRYTKFTYYREAKFDLSAFWFGAGITLKTR